jgi:hypothetical protein
MVIRHLSTTLNPLAVSVSCPHLQLLRHARHALSRALPCVQLRPVLQHFQSAWNLHHGSNRLFEWGPCYGVLNMLPNPSLLRTLYLVPCIKLPTHTESKSMPAVQKIFTKHSVRMPSRNVCGGRTAPKALKCPAFQAYIKVVFITSTTV